jgi:hypothetical protein
MPNRRERRRLQRIRNKQAEQLANEAQMPMETPKDESKKDRLALALALIGYVPALGWPVYEMTAPDPNVYIASGMLLFAAICFLAALLVYFQLGRRWKVALVLATICAFVWVDRIVITSLTPPNFVYIKPGVFANPGQPNAFWIFIVVHRGSSPLYNVLIGFNDQDREKQDSDSLSNGHGRVQWNQSLHYPEIDPITVGKPDAEVGSLYWSPGVINDEHYFIHINHRKEFATEVLQVKKIGNDWSYAMRYTDDRTHKKLIECRDSSFPIDSEWANNLPPCFPKYTATD